jgi:hypothetical protein
MICCVLVCVVCVGDEYATVSGFLQGEIEGPGHENVVAVNMVWTPFGTTSCYHTLDTRQLSHVLKGALRHEGLACSLCVVCLMCVCVYVHGYVSVMCRFVWPRPSSRGHRDRQLHQGRGTTMLHGYTKH